MRQRLALAGALLKPRELLVLDEPTNGLDPQGTREVRHLIADLAATGSTIFVSSHLLGEVDQMCSHLGIMRTGRLVAQGSVEDVRSSTTRVARVDTEDADAAARVLTTLGATTITHVANGIQATPVTNPPERIVGELVSAGVRVRGFAVSSPSLEDLFVELTGEGFDVSG